MLYFADSLLLGFVVGAFPLATEEVCNVVLVFGAVDGYEEGRRVIADLAHVLADRIDVQLALERLEERLQVVAPLGLVGIQPGAYGVGTILENYGHAVVQEVELLIGVGGDDRIRE